MRSNAGPEGAGVEEVGIVHHDALLAASPPQQHEVRLDHGSSVAVPRRGQSPTALGLRPVQDLS